MNALQEFLSRNKVDSITQEVRLNGRLHEFEFTIRPITGPQYNEYQTLCLENPTSAKKRNFNIKKFNELVVINGVTNPSFKDVKWIQTLGVADAASALYITLLSGEIAELADRILQLSGFNAEAVEDAKEEVKNS